MGGFESAKQSHKLKIGRWRVVADRGGEIGFQRTNLYLNTWRRLLGGATQRERGIFSVKIERGRNRCGYSSQKKRFLGRIDAPHKNWKFSSNDAAERDFWDDYMEAYEEMIQETATKHAPWYVVPADNKWFTSVVVAAAVIEALADLDLEYPELGEDKLKELAAAKKKLLTK